MGDVDQFVEKDLVVPIHHQILFVLLECFRLRSESLVIINLLSHAEVRLSCVNIRRNALFFGLVDKEIALSRQA